MLLQQFVEKGLFPIYYPNRLFLREPTAGNSATYRVSAISAAAFLKTKPQEIEENGRRQGI